MKRGLYKTRAIVLGTVDFGESDRILTIFTEDYGKVSGIAKGARRSRRRFVGNLEPLSHIKVIFFFSERNDLVRIEDSTLIDGFHGLRGDMEKLAQASYLLEIVNEMTKEGLVIPRVYELLVSFLKILEEAADELPIRFFEIKLLSVLGILPNLRGCVVCKDDLKGAMDGELFFSSEKGGLVCEKCSGDVKNLIPVSMGTARLLAAAVGFEVEKLSRFKTTPAFLRESGRLLDDFIKHQLGKELKTKRFMEKIREGTFCKKFPPEPSFKNF